MVQDQEHQVEVSSGIISLPFLPAFYVHTSEVHLSNLLPLTSVRISAVDKVIQDLKVPYELYSLEEIWAGDETDQVRVLVALLNSTLLMLFMTFVWYTSF